jgi:large subunit ribosomal protein L25
MSGQYAFKAETRDRAGKGVARALRREAKVPAVIYGDQKEPIKITLEAKDVNLEYNKGHMFTTLCNVEIGNDKHLVLARDVQLHPVSDLVEHVDFLRVNAKTKIAVFVPVHFIGQETSQALKDGGTLNVVRHEVEMMCSAMEIPEFIEADMSGVEMGDSVRISHAKLPEGASPVIKGRDFVLATLIAPKTAEQLEAEAAAELAAAPVPAEVEATNVASDAEVAAKAAAEGGDKKGGDKKEGKKE